MRWRRLSRLVGRFGKRGWGEGLGCCLSVWGTTQAGGGSNGGTLIFVVVGGRSVVLTNRGGCMGRVLVKTRAAARLVWSSEPEKERPA